MPIGKVPVLPGATYPVLQSFASYENQANSIEVNNNEDLIENNINKSNEEISTKEPGRDCIPLLPHPNQTFHTLEKSIQNDKDFRNGAKYIVLKEKIKVKPFETAEEIEEERKRLWTPKVKNVIEEEVRNFEEKEKEWRKIRGLKEPELGGVEQIVLGELKEKLLNNRNDWDEENLRKMSENFLKKEMLREKIKENNLLKEGKILTTSEERANYGEPEIQKPRKDPREEIKDVDLEKMVDFFNSLEEKHHPDSKVKYDSQSIRALNMEDFSILRHVYQDVINKEINQFISKPKAPHKRASELFNSNNSFVEEEGKVKNIETNTSFQQVNSAFPPEIIRSNVPSTEDFDVQYEKIVTSLSQRKSELDSNLKEFKPTKQETDELKNISLAHLISVYKQEVDQVNEPFTSIRTQESFADVDLEKMVAFFNNLEKKKCPKFAQTYDSQSLRALNVDDFKILRLAYEKESKKPNETNPSINQAAKNLDHFFKNQKNNKQILKNEVKINKQQNIELNPIHKTTQPTTIKTEIKIENKIENNANFLESLPKKEEGLEKIVRVERVKMKSSEPGHFVRHTMFEGQDKLIAQELFQVMLRESELRKKRENVKET